MNTLPIDYLKTIFSYNKETGDLIWLERPENHFKNKQAYTRFVNNYQGKIAGRYCQGTGNKQTYKRVSVDGREFFVHRIIWAITYDEWPECIDHINGDGLDNSLNNLRNVSVKENNQNAPIRSDNTSGHVGVSYDQRSQKWIAQIGCNGKTRTIGKFKNKQDAVNARKMAEKIGGYHQNHGR